MATVVWSNSDIGNILTAQEVTRDSYLILSHEIATLSILRINHLLHTSSKSKMLILRACFFTDIANKSRLGLQFPQWTMKGKEYGRKRQWNAIRSPCSYLKELRRITKNCEENQCPSRETDWVPANKSQGQYTACSELFVQALGGFSRSSKTVHCTENRNLFSAVYWIVQQDRRASPLHNGIHHPPSQTRFPSLASSPRNFLCIDYALEVGRARTHKQGLGYWCHVTQYLPPWYIPNIQCKSNQYQKD